MTPSRRPLIAGNWKMNGLNEDGVALAGDLAARIRAAGDTPFDMLVCPPFTLLGGVAAAIAGTSLALGAQDCHASRSGAHTGDIGAPMLADAGCRFVIVGHSERRADHGEDDATVKAKADAVLAAGLTAIVCVGETEAERDAGRTFDVVESQVAGSLAEAATGANTVVAYEPVWAIGSGRTPTATDVQDVHARIRQRLAERLGDGEAQALRILYGGSVKPAKAEELLGLADVDGGLVGGASLAADGFWAIAQSCH
jgi:triosephosphate isomerase